MARTFWGDPITGYAGAPDYYNQPWTNVPQSGGPQGYYNPTNGVYGTSPAFGPGFAHSDVGQRYWENNPQGAFTRWLAEKGVGQFTNFGKWAQGQYGDIRSGYQASLGDNPEMTFYGQPNSYLTSVNLADTWRSLPFQQRGAFPSLYATRARFLPRGQ